MEEANLPGFWQITLASVHCMAPVTLFGISEAVEMQKDLRDGDVC